LYDTPVLVREFSQNYQFWTINADLVTRWQWNRVNFDLGYDRSIENNNLLGRPSDRQSGTLRLGRGFGRTASFSGSVIYERHSFFNVQNSPRLDQGVVRADFKRQMASLFDFSIFAAYNKILRGVEQRSRFDHFRAGLRLSFQFPRVRPL
jgi:hypothetical protein